MKKDIVATRLGYDIVAWLSKAPDSTTNDQLVAWLQGYDFPPFGHDEEPYQWILRALVPLENRYVVDRELAKRCVSILRAKPDVARPGTRPEQVLENLFYLCAGLACPDILFDELYALYERRALVGEWSSGDLRAALRAALIHNQADRRLEEVWCTMLLGRRHVVLPGRPPDGFEGILYMSESLATADVPVLDSLGYAFRCMADYFESGRERERLFAGLIERALGTYPDRPSWSSDLVTMSSTHEWPTWATACLRR